ncbi:MAG: histidine kinase [Clostridia bacterium]|nr:histidine kinase [Clostridia bacterium]
MTGKISDEVMKKAVDIFKADSKKELDFFTATTPLFNAVYFCAPQQITFPSTLKVETEYIGTFIIVGQINIAELIRHSSISDADFVYLTNGADKKIDIITPSAAHKNNFNSEHKILDTEWQLCISMPINFPTPPIFMMFLLEIALLSLIFLFIQILLSHNIYKPIEKIYRFLNDYPKQLNHSHLNLKTRNELGIIADKINNMLDNTENLYRRIITTQQTLYETELMQRSTTLYALQAQLVPHFIYNTMDCICGLANTSGVPQIADIVVSLSRILRYSIKEEKEVLFIQELEILEYYITIQSIMFPDRFDVQFNISDETHSVHCLKMIVQPIAENVFKHAFKDPGKKYLLNISAYVNEKFLVVKIRDNGCGITAEKLKLIKEELSLISKTFFVEKKDTTHIGISNIQYRIFLNYGEDYKIDIDSKENEYTEVTLRLPNKESYN